MKYLLYLVLLGTITASAQAGVMIDRYGRTYITTYTDPSGVTLGIDPSSGQTVHGYTPMYPESDPSMFGQVRPDGSIIGLDH
jgi:hypothetical protein